MSLLVGIQNMMNGALAGGAVMVYEWEEIDKEKGFLSLKGFTRTKLRTDFGHNLVKLYDEAVAKGMGAFVTLQPGDRDVVAKANSAYDSRAGKKLQYFDVYDALTAFKSLPELLGLEDLANRLQAKALRDVLLKG